MKNDRNKHRRSIRLQNYDYKRSGAYFVTMVTQNRACLFGDVVNGRLQLNDAGQMIQAIWDQLPQHYPGVETDAFVIMPNHVHGIIALVGVSACADIQSGGQPQGVAPTNDPRPKHDAVHVLSLADIVHRFKTLTTKRYVDGVKQFDWSRFESRLWQRNYFEHVIRNEESLNRIGEYILDNPTRWEFDQENPLAMQPEPADAWR
jgi:REP element-mobilizing transposase RayT